MTLLADIQRLVAAFAPRSDRDADAQRDFAELFSDDRGPARRDDGPSHATASAFAFDPSLTLTLLVFHGKGRFWVQPGGHLENGDATIADAALRELREETGVTASASEPFVYDLNHHALASAFGRCRSHLDIGVAVVVDEDSPLRVSDESEDVRWWPVDALPADVPEGFERRVRGLLDPLRSSSVSPRRPAPR
ncbi:NUDIX hydrolase [Microbacterium sp. ZW T5_45]|uniref:NUDIX hydrolase n=1 Tax=Microbacterium sp. ZW T5_45 TaxID=3378080 RepID=UPI003853EA75